MDDMRSRHRHPFQHGAQGVEPPPEPHVAGKQFFRGHLFRFEGYPRLAVVTGPIIRNQPIRLFQFVIKPRARQWRQHAHRDAVNAHRFTSLQRLGEHSPGVRVEPKNHTRLHAHAMLMDTRDGFTIGRRPIEPLVDTDQTFLGKRFQPHKQINAAGLARE